MLWQHSQQNLGDAMSGSRLGRRLHTIGVKMSLLIVEQWQLPAAHEVPVVVVVLLLGVNWLGHLPGKHHHHNDILTDLRELKEVGFPRQDVFMNLAGACSCPPTDALGAQRCAR